MANSYFKYFPVRSPQEASVLANEDVWKILEALIKCGPKGLTEKEIYKQIKKTSDSKLYGLLKKLYDLEWVHRYYDRESEARRYVIKFVAGFDAIDDIDETFYESVIEKEEKFIANRISPQLQEFIKRTMNDLRQDPETKQWLPQSGFCKECHINHEAVEFVSSLLYIAVEEFLDKDEFIGKIVEEPSEE
jgi:hypothetical protein